MPWPPEVPVHERSLDHLALDNLVARCTIPGCRWTAYRSAPSDEDAVVGFYRRHDCPKT